MKYPLFLLLFMFFSVAEAVELFGVELSRASSEQLRNALKKSGAKLIREAGKNEFFDVYESSTILQNSRRLYLGFVKENRQFAFAEYEFNGLQQQDMLKKLTDRYGKARKISGKYLTDVSWKWQNNGVEIILSSDWQAYSTRLIYQIPHALKLLKQEQDTYLVNLKQQQDTYLSQAY